MSVTDPSPVASPGGLNTSRPRLARTEYEHRAHTANRNEHQAARIGHHGIA